MRRGWVYGVLCTAALAWPAAAFSHGGNTALVHSCVKSSGGVRIVGARSKCHRGERALDWPKSARRTRGAPGLSGPPGARGPTGVAGPTGAPGAAGSQGAKGDRGPTGPGGSNSSTGASGPRGATGPPGVAGPTGPAGTVSTVDRAISIPLASFIDCQTNSGAMLDFTSGNDSIADFTNSSTDGQGFTIQFDAGAPPAEAPPDEDSEICSQLLVPPDYVSGAGFLVRASKSASTGNPELITCGVSVNGVLLLPAGSVTATAGNNLYTCTPTSPVLTSGSSVSFYLSIASVGTMDNAVDIHAVAFRYTSQQ
jgi:Collagen triple helix repeat (20 copies)